MTISDTGIASRRPSDGPAAIFDFPTRDKPADDSEVWAGKHYRVAFFLAHEQPHQIPHCAPILNELSNCAHNIDIRAFVLGSDNVELLIRFLSPAARSAVTITTLSTSPVVAGLEWLTGSAAPLRRIEAVLRARQALSGMDMIVGTATTFLMLRTHFGLKNVKLVYTGHGAGDRAVGFKPVIKKFDHVLLSGEKLRERMIRERVLNETQLSVVGYPKFNAFVHHSGTRPRLFESDNPTVLYNPHFDPAQSSWYRHGEQVLELFAGLKGYNLIFAPHIMVFSRRLHASANPLCFRWRKSLRKCFENYSNIHIDTGSDSSIDMTYTRAADIYLGDVSSQVYEFIMRPRPCIFLNSHKIDWQNHREFVHWHFGQVVTSPFEIESALENRLIFEALHRRRQEDAFEKTFGTQVEQSATNAAKVLLNLLG